MRFAFVILSATLTAAHFFRIGNLGAAVACLLIIPLPFLKRNWMVPVIQAAFIVFFLSAVDTLISLVQVRRMMGAPWIRLTIIMGTISLVHLAGFGWYFRKQVQGRFSLGDGTLTPSVIACFVTAALFTIVQFKAPPGMLLLGRFFPGGGWAQALLLSLYAAFITEKMLDKKAQPLWRRRIWSLFSIVFFSQLALGLLGFDRFLMSGKLHIPVPAVIAAGPIFRGDGFFMIILFGATLILVGPAWCSHLCYIGAWDNLLADKKKRPTRLPKWAIGARAAILALVIFGALSLRLLGASTGVAATAGLSFGIIGVLSMFFISRKQGTMVHCTVYCPMGLLANIVGKISPFRIRIEPGCDQCGLCTTACRYDALSKENIAAKKPGLTCALCGDCLQRCNNGHIGYRFGALKSPAVRTAFIVIVVSIQAVFLGTARL